MLLETYLSVRPADRTSAAEGEAPSGTKAAGLKITPSTRAAGNQLFRMEINNRERGNVGQMGMGFSRALGPNQGHLMIGVESITWEPVLHFDF